MHFEEALHAQTGHHENEENADTDDGALQSLSLSSEYHLGWEKIELDAFRLLERKADDDRDRRVELS